MNSKETFRLSEEDLSNIGAIEEELDNEKALAIYWRYLGSKMGFDARTVATTGEGEFSAVTSVPDIRIVREWSGFLGGCTGHFVSLTDGSLLCCSEGLVGIYESERDFNEGTHVALVCV